MKSTEFRSGGQKMDELRQSIADLEAQQAEIQSRLDAAETDEEARRITDELNVVYNKLSPLYEQRDKEQTRAVEIEQRTQAQEEHNGGLKEAIRQIFGAVCPSNLAEVVGLTEYGEMLQTFNALVEEAVNENNTALYAMIGQQIEAKDTKIQELTTANIGLSADVQEAQTKAEQSSAEVEAAEQRYTAAAEHLRDLENGLSQANETIAAKQREIDSLQSVIQNKDEEINRLRGELSKAPEPRSAIAPYKPSESLQDRIAASQSKIKSSLELALEGSRFRGKISAVEPPPFEYAEPTATVPESDRIFATETPTAVEQQNSQFQTENEQAVPEHVLHGTVAQEPVGQAETVTRGEFEALKRFTQRAQREIRQLKEQFVGVTESEDDDWSAA